MKKKLKKELARLTKVAVAERVDEAALDQGQRLSVARAARHLQQSNRSIDNMHKKSGAPQLIVIGSRDGVETN